MAGSPKKRAKQQDAVKKAAKRRSSASIANINVLEVVPYTRPLDADDPQAPDRRAYMDALLHQIAQYGLDNIAGCVAMISLDTAVKAKYSISTVQSWLDTDVDGFKGRANDANAIFLSNIAMALIDHAHDPSYQRAETLLMMVNNGFNARLFKQTAASQSPDPGSGPSAEFLELLRTMGANMDREMSGA